MAWRKTRTNVSKYLSMTLFMKHMNVVGAFVIGMALYEFMMDISCYEYYFVNVLILNFNSVLDLKSIFE
jgi:hypothetical protein